jgi:hypothetical protein
MYSLSITRREYAFESYEKALDGGHWKFAFDQVRSSLQFCFMVCRLGLAVACECFEPTIGPAVRVRHQENPFGAVQLNGKAKLLKNEVALAGVARRCKRLRTASDDDHVGMRNALLLKKLAYNLPDALIKTAQHGCVGSVVLRRGIEVEDFAHDFQRELIVAKPVVVTPIVVILSAAI